MVTDSQGYIHIIEYLIEHLSLFEQSAANHKQASMSVMALIEQELSEQIINVCAQNEALSFNQRNAIIREIDAIVCDLEEILASVKNNPATAEQKAFIQEFSLLIKNLFDTEIHSNLLN